MKSTHSRRLTGALRTAVQTVVEQLERRRLLTGSITGSVWDDANGNGVRDTGEQGLSGWTVYLDQNRNQVLDTDELSRLTAADGSYSFTQLIPGRYHVAQTVKPGWQQTSPSAARPSSPQTQVPRTAFTGSKVEVEPAGLPAPIGADGQVLVRPADAESNQLIRLNDLRNDARFSNVDGRGYAVAILDTGIDTDHPFFGADLDQNGVADRIVFQHDFADGDADASDVNGHGSNVTSIAAGSGSSALGMAPGANIIALKVFGNSGSGQFGYIESALQWLIANAEAYNVAAVNMSLSDMGNHASSQGMYGIQDELAALAAKNVIVVSAAGNEYASFQTQGVAYPAADPNSLAVGAVYDANLGGSWSYSGGATDYSTGADRIVSFSQRSTTLTDIFAPGALINGANAYGGTVGYTGTSQAAPHVAGLAVLAQQMATQMLGRRLSTSEFGTLLRQSGVSIYDGDDENDNVVNTYAAYQRVDAMKLAEAIEAMRGTGYPTGHAINLADGQTRSATDFLNRPLSLDLAAPDLAAASDSGILDSDNITRLDNSNATRKLSFRVSGTIADGVVTIYANGVAIATGPAAAGSTVVTTAGDFDLPDGQHQITARQTVGGRTSAASPALTIVVDTTAPATPAPISMDPASDRGLASNDGITSERNPLFRISASEAGIARFRVDGGSTYAARRVGRDGTVTFPAMGSNVSLSSAQIVAQPAYSQAAATADFDLDGKLDAAVFSGINSDPKFLTVSLGNGNGTFRSLASQSVDFWGGKAVAGDFNEDGKPDLLVAAPNTVTSVVLMLGNGDGTFRGGTRLSNGGAPFGMAAGDINGDGNLDALVTQLTTGATLRVLLGRGDGTFGDRTFDLGMVPMQPHLVDLNNDGNVDVVAVLNDGGAVHAVMGNGDGTFGAVRAFGSPAQAMTGRLTAGDYDGDGWVDVAVSGGSGIAFLRNDSKGNLEAPRGGPSLGGTPWELRTADFNADGALDIAYIAGSNKAGVITGHGDGTFSAASGPLSLGIGAGPMVLGDFNGDGTPDIVGYGGDTSVAVSLTGYTKLGEGTHTIDGYIEDVAGNFSGHSTGSAFRIDISAPTVQFAAVSPTPRTEPVTSLTFTASEAIGGVDITDLELTRDGGPDLLTGAQTLSTGDNRTFTVGNLGSLTAAPAAYILRLRKVNTGITDTAGNPLAADASVSWNMQAVAPQTGSIAGLVYNDVNGNGVRDTGETAALSGRTVYIDADDDGMLDTGERSFTTHVDGFGFNDLPVGTYVLRQIVPTGWRQTAPADKHVVTLTAGQRQILYFGTQQPQAQSTYLSDLSWASASSPYSGIKKNLATSGNPLRIGGTTYAKGLGVHSPSTVTYTLGGQYNRFTAAVGVDDAVANNGSVVFEVWVDGVLKKASTRRTGVDGAELLDVDVTGAQQLRLVTTTGGDSDYCDHANWADAKLYSGGTVTPAKPTVSLFVEKATAGEGATPNRGMFWVSRGTAGEAPLTVNYTLSGTATNGTDYTSLSGSATIPAGQVGVMVYVDPVDDTVVESTESVVMTLSPGAAYNLGTTTSGTVTIADNDAPPATKPSVGVSTYANALAAEAGQTAAFAFSTNGPSVTSPLTIYYTVTGSATAGSDYQTLTGSVTIPAGFSGKDVLLVPIDDLLVEGDETVIVTIQANAAYDIHKATQTLVIKDDDQPPATGQETWLSDLNWTTATSPYSGIKKNVATSGNPLRIGGTTYTKGLGVHSPSTVTYNLGGQYSRFTAMVGVDDAVGNNGSAVFEVWVDGVLKKASTRRTGADGAEFVDVDISGAQQLRLVTTTGGDSDYCDHANWAEAKLFSGGPVVQKPTVSVAATDAAATEAGDGGTFTFTRSGDLTEAIVVNYSVGGTAAAGSDYTSLAGSITFAAGSATATVQVTPVQDTLVEGDETVVVTLTPSANFLIGNGGGTATVTIVDDDAPPVSQTTYLSDLNPTSAVAPFGGVKRNVAISGNPLRIGGTTYAKGIGVHSHSEVTYNLGGKYGRFTSYVGIDDAVGNGATDGSAVFQVWVDGKLVKTSARLTGAMGAEFLDVDVTGAQTLKLVTTTGGDSDYKDHADWADAKLTA